MGGRRILPEARKTRFPDLGVQIRRGPLQATSWHFANIPDHLYTGKQTKMNKTSPLWAFISAANPFSGQFQVFNFRYKDTPGRGRFLTRLTCLNRISTERNELELASFPNLAATPTLFTKNAHAKEAIHTPCSLKKLFWRLSRRCTLYRRVPGRVECPNFPLAETGWLPLAETDLRRPQATSGDLKPTWNRISATRTSQVTIKCALESWKRRGQHPDTLRMRLTSPWGDFWDFSPRDNDTAPRAKPA